MAGSPVATSPGVRQTGHLCQDSTRFGRRSAWSLRRSPGEKGDQASVSGHEKWGYRHVEFMYNL